MLFSLQAGYLFRDFDVSIDDTKPNRFTIEFLPTKFLFRVRTFAHNVTRSFRSLQSGRQNVTVHKVQKRRKKWNEIKRKVHTRVEEEKNKSST